MVAASNRSFVGLRASSLFVVCLLLVVVVGGCWCVDNKNNKTKGKMFHRREDEEEGGRQHDCQQYKVSSLAGTSLFCWLVLAFRSCWQLLWLLAVLAAATLSLLTVVSCDVVRHVSACRCVGGVCWSRDGWWLTDFGRHCGSKSSIDQRVLLIKECCTIET